MKTVGTYEAKTQLPRLLQEVERGEQITITRRGKPIAILSPILQRDRGEIQSAIDSMRRLSKGVTLGNVTIKELLEEGRR